MYCIPNILEPAHIHARAAQPLYLPCRLLVAPAVLTTYTNSLRMIPAHRSGNVEMFDGVVLIRSEHSGPVQQ